MSIEKERKWFFLFWFNFWKTTILIVTSVFKKILKLSLKLIRKENKAAYKPKWNKSKSPKQGKETLSVLFLTEEVIKSCNFGG